MSLSLSFLHLLCETKSETHLPSFSARRSTEPRLPLHPRRRLLHAFVSSFASFFSSSLRTPKLTRHLSLQRWIPHHHRALQGDSEIARSLQSGRNESIWVRLRFLRSPLLSFASLIRFPPTVKCPQPSDSSVSSILRHLRRLILVSESLERTRGSPMTWFSRTSLRSRDDLSTTETTHTGLRPTFTSEFALDAVRNHDSLRLTLRSTCCFLQLGDE